MTFFHGVLYPSAALPALARQPAPDAIVIAAEQPCDLEAREALLDRAFGPARFRKTCQTLRVGRLPARGLALVARLSDGTPSGKVVGTVRLWHVMAGGVPALMLGPLAVDATSRSHGIGAKLMVEAIARASALGHKAILLIGDAPYYVRFGFDRRHTVNLKMPGPIEDERFLGLELHPGAFADARGVVKGTGAVDMAARRRTQPAQKSKVRGAA